MLDQLGQIAGGNTGSDIADFLRWVGGALAVGGTGLLALWGVLTRSARRLPFADVMDKIDGIEIPDHEPCNERIRDLEIQNTRLHEVAVRYFESVMQYGPIQPGRAGFDLENGQ